MLFRFSDLEFRILTMYPKGTIYKSNKSKQSFGVFSLHAPFRVRVLYAMIQSVGIMCIVSSIIFALYIITPAIKEEVVYAVRQAPVPTVIRPQDQKVIGLELPKKTKQEIQTLAYAWGVNSKFSIVVPKIEAKANIVANVDTAKEEDYLNALKVGVAHAKGTNFPGEGKLIYLFSHSTNSPLEAARWDAVFYLLDKVHEGDHVIIFYQDKKYEYEVTETRVVAATDISWLRPAENDKEVLILQTCTPPGTSWKRLLVIAKPI
jgi:LPXTG-site transpeptidase (sortase) family protein